MKIAYVHTGDWPSNSPSFTFVTLNAIGLAGSFKKCTLFVKENTKEGIESVLMENFNLSKPDNLEIKLIKKNIFFKSNQQYFSKVKKELIRLIKNDELDVVITRNSTFLKHLAELKHEFGIKVFYETHDFFADLSLRSDIDVKRKRKYEKFERLYISKLDGVICLQNEQRKLYKKTFPNTNIYLARTGIQSIENINKETRYVTYIGSFDLHKGILDLVQSLNLTKSQPELLLIGGKTNEDIDKTDKIIKKYYRHDKVTITGWVDKSEISRYLRNTALGIVPLTDTFFNRYLTSPLKIFDYFSHCIPVIASDLPTVRELVSEGNSGLFYKSGDIEEMAEKIDLLFSDKSLIGKMRSYIEKHSDVFLWSSRAKSIRGIIEENEN